jgi:hypothetical protein
MRSAIFVILGTIVGILISFAVQFTITQPNLRTEYYEYEPGYYVMCVVNNWGGVSCDWEGVLR